LSCPERSTCTVTSTSTTRAAGSGRRTTACRPQEGHEAAGPNLDLRQIIELAGSGAVR
jgi:hypothetical protein